MLAAEGGAGRGERLNPAEGHARGGVLISLHSEVTVHLSAPGGSAGGSMSAEVAKSEAICMAISIPLRRCPGSGRYISCPPQPAAQVLRQ